MARTSKSSPRRNPYGHIKRSEGKRSGLEVAVAASLRSAGVSFQEEKEISAVEYTNSKVKKYHPDFRLPNGIYIEAKGWFKTADRTKHLCIKYQHPDMDIRFVFSNPNQRIGKKSKTTYAMWCEKNGFQYAHGSVPVEWTKELCRHTKDELEHKQETSCGKRYWWDECTKCGAHKNAGSRQDW